MASVVASLLRRIIRILSFLILCLGALKNVSAWVRFLLSA